MRIHWRMLGGVIVCVILVTGLLLPWRADRAAFSATPEADSPAQVESIDGMRRPGVLRLDPSTSTFRISPPATYTQRSPSKVQTAAINVTYLPNGAIDGFGYSCLTWPTEAIDAFEYAASIWETLITSTVPIEINACWTNFGDPDILGIGGADDYYSNFTGAPLANTLYPTALANALHGSRMHGSTVDMHVAYGSTFPWYYGTDGNTLTGQVDFATVVLHEICHGLGFAGSMMVKSGLGYWGWDYYSIPAAYDRFTENGTGTALLNYPNGSAALAAQLTSENLYFNGPHANAGNGGARPKLFAPSTWMQGSSYSHLDEIFNGTADDLMTYAIPNGQSMHAPGPITLGMLQDIGWSLLAANVAPTLSGLPDLALTPGEARDNAIDLWTYATDDSDTDADLTFAITSSPPVSAGVSIGGDRYIDINPAAGFLGVVPVTVEVMDTGGLTDTDTFTITFAEIVNTAPTLSGLPDLALTPGEARDNAIDLWTYATDDLDADDVMTYTITNSPPLTVGVTIDSDRYIDVNPTASFTGTFPIVIEVMDTGGLTDTDAFSITFAEILNTAPALSGLPDQELGPNQSKDNAIDLWAYAFDAEDLDADLAFTFTNSLPVSAGVSIDSNRYIDINPAAGFSGTVPVDVQVMDTGGLTDTDTFTINFLETQYIYLPLAMRCYPLVPSLLPISNPDGDGLYTVQWTMPSCSTQTPSQYEFQLATDPQFNYVDGDTTTATSVNVYTPDPATYYWRVRAYINGQWTGWSNVRSVTVGAFSYAFVYNATGGTLTIEIVGIEKRSFATGFEGYWRSVPVGTYTVKVWAHCGYLQESMYFPLGEFHDLAFECRPAASLSSVPSTTAVPGVDFVFKSPAP